MASKVVTFKDFYSGETKSFGFTFTPPYTGFNWSTVVLGCTLTNDPAPSTNTTAAAQRSAQTLTVDGTTNIAMYVFQLTITEANALTPGSYKVQAKLTQNGAYVIKPITGTVKVLQDYEK